MTENPSALHYIVRQPSVEGGPRPPLLMLLHGYGSNEQDLMGLAPAINPTGYVYACPNAPIPFQLGPGQTGFGWMTPRGGGTPEETENSVQLVGDFIDTIFEEFNVKPRQALLLGFSQGGGMTYRCGLSRADKFAGLVALSATLPEQDELAAGIFGEQVVEERSAHTTDVEIAGRARCETDPGGSAGIG